MKDRYLIILSGATAVGKTEAALHLAKKYNTAILSADSRQIYKEISIGTAKPTLEEMQGIPHYFINHQSIFNNYTVGDYEKEALEVLEDWFQKREVVLLVGGTGFYIRAVTDGLDALPASDPAIQADLEKVYEEEGIEPLQAQLKDLDAAYYEKIDTQNPHRLMRAINICLTTKQPISTMENHRHPRNFKTIHLNLVRSREALYERINTRVDAMLDAGLEVEARTLWKYHQFNALQTVGYREWFDYFEGKIDYQTAVETIKRNTRRYAKRQLTWFRNIQDTKHFEPHEIEPMIDYIEFVREKKASFSWERMQKAKFSDVRFSFTTPEQNISSLVKFHKGTHHRTDFVEAPFEQWVAHDVGLMPFWF